MDGKAHQTASSSTHTTKFRTNFVLNNEPRPQMTTGTSVILPAALDLMPAHAAVAIEPAGNMRRTLTAPELRSAKSRRDEFLGRPRRPITVAE
jgi:hypothetical protein